MITLTGLWKRKSPLPSIGRRTAAAAMPFFIIWLVTEANVEWLTTRKPNVMRNEIFTHHDRGFNRADLQAYFDQQPWYARRYDPEDFPTDRLLTDIQKQNAGLILAYQGQ